MLAIGISVLTGTMTNFMSDGATVAALGPIVLPMADLANVHVWKLGLACAFSSSFANFLVVGTPNNAIAFGMGRDPETGGTAPGRVGLRQVRIASDDPGLVGPLVLEYPRILAIHVLARLADQLFPPVAPSHEAAAGGARLRDKP